MTTAELKAGEITQVAQPELPKGLHFITPDESHADAFWDLGAWGFGHGDAWAGREWAAKGIEWDRTQGIALDDSDEELVAMSGAWTFDLPVPGGRLPAGGFTWVTVRPDFRRRGLLRHMVYRHFNDCLRRGEPLSILTASEMGIYAGFGYGVASRSLTLNIPTGTALREVAGSQDVQVRFDTASAAKHLALRAELLDHERVSDSVRPGWVTDNTEGRRNWPFEKLFRDPDAEPLRIAISRVGGEVTGFALFRRSGSYAGKQICTVVEAWAGDAASNRALWSSLINLDLTKSVITPELPLDDPLLALLKDFRVAHPQYADLLHVRIIDLPSALSGRSYALPINLVIEVTDELINENAGRWRLIGDVGGGKIREELDVEPDLVLDIRELGAIYLGGTSVSSLVDANLIVEKSPGAAQRLALAFSSFRQPGITRIF